MLDMHEVVDYSAESPKYVHTQNEQELEAPARNWANRIVQSDKSDSLILSAPMVVRGTVDFDKGIPLLTKWCLARARDKIHDNSQSCGGG
jgi:hypothetical protein